MKSKPAAPPPAGSQPAGSLVRDHITWAAEIILHPDHPMSEALTRMRDAEMPFAPVVDGDAIVGVLSLRLLGADPDGPPEEAPGTAKPTVLDAMHSTVPFLYDDDPLVLGASIAAQTEIGHFCVVDSDHLLIGILSFDDADREGTDIDPLPLPAAVPPVAEATVRRRLVATSVRAAPSEPGVLTTYAEGPTLYVDGRTAHEPLDRPDPASRRRRGIAMKSKL